MARKSAKLTANFSATMASWLPSISLCISFSLSLSLSHRAFLTHNIGSASTQSKPQFIQESTRTASSGSTWLCVVHHDPAQFSLCRQAGLPSNLSKTISVALIICIAICFGLAKMDCCRVSLPFALSDSFFLSFIFRYFFSPFRHWNAPHERTLSRRWRHGWRQQIQKVKKWKSQSLWRVAIQTQYNQNFKNNLL